MLPGRRTAKNASHLSPLFWFGRVFFCRSSDVFPRWSTKGASAALEPHRAAIGVKLCHRQGEECSFCASLWACGLCSMRQGRPCKARPKPDLSLSWNVLCRGSRQGVVSLWTLARWRTLSLLWQEGCLCPVGPYKTGTFLMFAPCPRQESFSPKKPRGVTSLTEPFTTAIYESLLVSVKAMSAPATSLFHE